MALGFSFPSFPPFHYFLLVLLFPAFFPAHSDGLHIVGREHALLARALNAAVHPALVNLLHVLDHVPVHKRHFIVIGGRVVVHCSVYLLSTKTKSVS